MDTCSGDRARVGPRLISPLCCLLLALLGSAPAAGGVSLEAVSVRGGGSYSAFEGSFHDAVGKYLAGFTAAGALSLRLGPVPLQIELWMVRKGGRTGPFTFTVTGFDTTGFDTFEFPGQRWVVPYVETPLLARFEVGSGTARPYVVLGPGLAYRLGGSVEDEGDYSYYTSRTAPGRLQRARIFEELGPFNPVRHFRKFDMDAIAGAGLVLGSGRNRVLFEARWMEGLLDILPEGSVVKGRNRTIVVTLGLERH